MNYNELEKEFGKVKKITYKQNSYCVGDSTEETLIGIMLADTNLIGIDDTKVRVIFENGEIYSLYAADILKIGRCVPKKDVKEALLNIYKNEMAILNLTLKTIELKREKKLYDIKRHKYVTRLLTVQGIV